MEKPQNHLKIREHEDQDSQIMCRGRKIRKTNECLRKQNDSECQQQEGLYTHQLRILQFESFYSNKISNFSSLGQIPDADHIIYHAFHTEYNRGNWKQSNSSSFQQLNSAGQARRSHKTSLHDHIFQKDCGKQQIRQDNFKAQRQKMEVKIAQNQTSNQSSSENGQKILYSGPIQLQTLDGNEYLKACTIVKEDHNNLQGQLLVCLTVNSKGKQKGKFLMSEQSALKIKKTASFLIESLKSWNYCKEQWEDNFLSIQYY